MNEVSLILLVIIVIGGFYLFRKYQVGNGRGDQNDRGIGFVELFSLIRDRQEQNARDAAQQSIERQHNSRQRERYIASTNHRGVNRQVSSPQRRNISETGMMVYFANDRHGRRDKEYRFNFKKVDNGWRAYILRMPSLENRSTSGSVIHRLSDNNGYYICWDRQVNSLKDMQIISRRWADSIQEYISTGRFG